MAKKVDYSKLEKALKQASKAAASGKYTQEQINQYILDSGFESIEAFEKAVVNRASIDVNKNIPTSEKGVLQGYFREVANGLTMGLWGKGEALVSSIINRTPYDYERDLMETERADYQEANPVHSTIGNIGGAMTTGAGLTKAALAKLPSLAPKAGAPIANYAKEAGLEGTIGAVEGGLTALNEGGDVGKSTGFGTGIGVLAPAVSRVAGPVIDHVKQGAKRVGEVFDPTVGSNVFVKKPPGLVPGEPTLPEKRALDKVEEALTDDAVSPADRRTRLKEFEETGLGDAASPSFLGGENLNQLAKDAVVESGPQKQAVKKALLETMEENRGRVQQFMDDGLGYNKEGSPQVVDELMEQRTRKAKPLYDKAFETKPIDGGSEEGAAIEDIMSSKAFRKAYKEAQETNAEAVNPQYMPDLPDLEKGETGIWSMYALDQVKKIIDLRRRLPPSAQNAPNKIMAKNLGEKTEILLDEMDQFSPSYGEARKIWSGSMEETDAYELGMSAYNTSKKSSVIRSEFKKLKTEAEREMYRLGASTEAIGKMDQATAGTKSHSKVFSSPDQIAKHKILFPNASDAEKFGRQLELLNSVQEAANSQIPRSDTGSNIIKFVRRGVDIATTGSGATGAVVKTGQMLADPLRMVQQRQTNKAVGDLLSPKGKKETGAVLNKLDNRQKELSDKLISRSLLSGGITGAGAHLMGGRDKKQGSLLSTSY